MSVSRFYQIELEKLKVEFERISIFTNHPGTLGTYREHILKNYIRNFIPNFLSVHSGFVSHYKNAEKDMVHSLQTKQIDLIIHDENYHTPFFKSLDFSIIEPESLYAAIEVKSNLTFYKKYGGLVSESEPSHEYPFNDGRKYYIWAGTLIDALENIKSISSITNCYKQKVFYGIFAYESSTNFNTLFNAFDNNQIQRQMKLNHIDELPSYICCLDGTITYFGRSSLFEAEVDGKYDITQTEMSHVSVSESNKAFPLQLFTIALKVNVDAFLTAKNPHKSGLFTGGLGEITIWNHHFDLPSEYRVISSED